MLSNFNYNHSPSTSQDMHGMWQYLATNPQSLCPTTSSGNEDAQILIPQTACGSAGLHQLCEHVVGQHELQAIHAAEHAIVNTMHRAWWEDDDISCSKGKTLAIAEAHALSYASQLYVRYIMQSLGDQNQNPQGTDMSMNLSGSLCLLYPNTS